MRLPRRTSATAQALDAADPDLNAFNAAGGKLIQYHGWNDAAIPAQSSINYYQSVAAKMDQARQRPLVLPTVYGTRDGSLWRGRWPECGQRRFWLTLP